MSKMITIAVASLLAVFSAACTNSSPTTTTNGAPVANSNTASTAGNHDGATTDKDVPDSVRAVFPDAQSITKQHKDIPVGQIALIEKEAGAKVPDTDHHSYLAFSTAGGARRQIGAATIVKASGKEMVVIYESREGKPYIKEIRAEGVSQGFLDQFKGKGHDDKFQIGGDLKAQGVDDATAKAIASAVRVDIMTMQTLYGAPDKH